MTGRVDFGRDSWPDIEAAIRRDAIAVLAIGAAEQHGAHLPLTTDTVLAHGVAGRIADALNAILLPPITYGDAWNNEAFTGTLSLSPDTLRSVIADIGLGVLRMGAKALVIVNGHFGNREPIALAARRLSGDGLPVMYLDYPSMEVLAGHVCESKPAAPGFYHADEVETSMMLVFAPDTVDMSRAEPEYPDFPETFGMEPMQLRQFNATGVFGDPRPSTVKKGEALIAGIVEESVRLIKLFRARTDRPGSIVVRISGET